MSQEKIIERYKNKEWLKHQYIDLNKTIKEISEEFGYSKSTLSRYKDRFQLKKYKKKSKTKISKEELVKLYIDQNKTAIEISEILNVNRGYIFDLISRWNIIKNEKDKSYSKKRRVYEISKERYGVDHFNSSEDIQKKRKNTNLKKYGSESFFRTEEYKNKEDKRNTILWGKTAYEWAVEYEITNIIVYRWLYRNQDASKKEFLEFLTSYEKGISNIENIIKTQLNLDFYNKYFSIENYPDLKYKPDFKISDKSALNVDGLYWHSELRKDDKLYHFNMRKEYEDLGLRIFQFREDEIYDKLPIIKSMIKNHNGKSKRIFARKTKVVLGNQKTADLFYNKTHIMGSIKAKHIFLEYDDKIVMGMSFKIKKNILKIERMSSQLNHSIVGGFSKLLSYLNKNFEFDEIHYWVDLRYGTGNFLLGFEFEKTRDTLGWKWTNFKETFNRLKCRANMDDRKLTQAEHAEELKWYKIYDAGQRLYIKREKKHGEHSR